MPEEPTEQPLNQWTLTITAEAEVVKGNQPDEEDES
jgi:hypothetical protein